MKIYEWNIGMAATIPSNKGYQLLSWVIDEIVKDEPDCIVLTEFVVSKGIDHFLDVLEKKNYQWFISSITKCNGILIALRMDSFSFNDTFNYYKDTVKNGNDILIGNNLPNLYEVQVTLKNGHPLSIIGVRICVSLNNHNKKYKDEQFKALDDYLSSQNHDVICIGDFNAYWGNSWNTVKNRTMIRTMQNGYSLYTPLYGEGDWYSYVQSNGNKNQLDHLITNINNNDIAVKYDWSFMNSSRYPSDITKESPIKVKGMPDHAILKATIV